MSGLPPPPPPNAIQPQPNATEALRAALAVAQQAAGGQPNAFLRPAIGAADPLVGVAAAPARIELVLRNENLGGLGGIYQPQRPRERSRKRHHDISDFSDESTSRSPSPRDSDSTIAQERRPLAGVAPILDKVAGAPTQNSPPNLAQTANERQTVISFSLGNLPNLSLQSTKHSADTAVKQLQQIMEPSSSGDSGKRRDHGSELIFSWEFQSTRMMFNYTSSGPPGVAPILES
ncbi:hypothetical protein CAEBREN_08457 [Caenorhabditis brenneri]|uniref:Uncharacterized protein n=1 Tax=Caenorhabditis brenneri TaxID=135651 RepID=G0PA12_CAEBE|nr:hypothetical protein CAEBREN_08457 [Caenorhabditis brenneri]